MNDKPSMLKATMIGGGALGVAGAIPIVDAVNMCCCALIIAGGFLAAFLYSKECARAAVAFRPGNGAVVGLVAGLFYALASTVVGGARRLVFGAPDMDQMVPQMEQSGAPPWLVDAMAQGAELFARPLGIVISFFVTLLLAAIFSTIGGTIGGAVFKVEPPQPPGFAVDPDPRGPAGPTPGV